MTEPTIKKTHELLEKLAEYVMNEVPRKDEVDQKIDRVDAKIDKLAGYVVEKIPKIEQKLEEKADKEDVQQLLEGQDKIAQQLDIIRTEQTAFHSGLRRIETRVEKLEKVH